MSLNSVWKKPMNDELFIQEGDRVERGSHDDHLGTCIMGDQGTIVGIHLDNVYGHIISIDWDRKPISGKPPTPDWHISWMNGMHLIHLNSVPDVDEWANELEFSLEGPDVEKS